MSNPLISVIIPAFNAALFLERALESVFRQTYAQREVILVDDGSTDATPEIILKYADKITFATQGNRGPSAARNHGLSLSRGEFVAFLDADDYWLPDFLSRCLQFFEQYPEAAAVSTGQKIINWKGEALIKPPILRSVLEKQKARLLSDFFPFWAAQDHIQVGCCVIHRTLIEHAGYMREDLRISEDLEYWGYLATFGSWGFIPDILYVDDSASCAAAQGWLTRHRPRRQACPTVEAWQQRLAPRLKDADWEGFRVVRGRVAQAFAYAKLLGGDIPGARHIAQHYGADFPVNGMSRLLRLFAPRGLTAWKVMSLALLCRETCKDWRLQRAHCGSLGKISLSTHKAL